MLCAINCRVKWVRNCWWCLNWRWLTCYPVFCIYCRYNTCQQVSKLIYSRASSSTLLYKYNIRSRQYDRNQVNILQWRHNERDGVWNPRRLHWLLNRLFRRRLKKTLFRLMALSVTPWLHPSTCVRLVTCMVSDQGTTLRASDRHNALPPILHQQTCRIRTYINMCPPDSKDHGAYMGSIWGRQDPGGLHVGPMKLTISVSTF